MTVRTIDDIFRDFVIPGVPASGPFNPHKPDIRDTLKALLEGISIFPDNRVIRLNNANSGTPNNIVVTSSVAIPSAAYQVLYIVNVTQENTGAVTVSGAINRTLVTNTSRPIEPGYLQPGMALLCIDTGTYLRLLSYGDAEAILAAAEDAAARAEAAAAGLNLPVIEPGDAGKSLIVNAEENGYTLDFRTSAMFDNREDFRGASIGDDVNFVIVTGYYLPGDGGISSFRIVEDDPNNTGGEQTADGKWWELSDVEINIRQFGAKLDGAHNDYQAFMDAVEFKNSKGGGNVYLTGGRMATETPIKIGNGSDTQVSTKHHRICIIGEGVGGHDGLDFVQQIAATEILYIGATTAEPVFELAGPLHSMGMKNFTVNADKKATVGIRINHVTDSLWTNVTTKRCVLGWDYTTRSGFPSGCVYGTGNNIALHCYNVEPTNGNSSGMRWTSGVSENLSLTGRPDTANCDFIGGVYFYGGSANSEGVLIHGADNNTLNGTQFIPEASPSFGYSVRFRQWSGDTRFPMENVFTSLGAKDPVGGTSGTLGNTFTIFQEGDGAALPTLPYVNVLSHSGVQIINGERVYRTRRIDQKISVTTQATNSITYVPITGYQSTALTGVLAGTKLRINFTGKVGKVTSGSGSFIIRRNGADEGSTEIDIPFNASYQNASISIILTVSATANQSVGVYFKSSDANNVSIVNGILTVEELY